MAGKKALAMIPNRKQLQQLKRLTVTNIGMKLLNIFTNHIGSENAISRAALFRKVFGRAELPSLADEFRWDYVKRAMHLVRQRTKCFIGSMRERSTWKYFVLRTQSDAQHYIDTLERNIKRMRVMQRKATKSVEEKWHRLDWKADAQRQIK